MQLGLYENKIEWKKLNLSVIFSNPLQNWFELLANAVKTSQNCDCIKFHEQAEIVRDFYEKTKCHFTTFWTNSDKSNRFSPSVFCATYAACFAAACWFETAELAYPFGRQRKTCVEVFFFLNHNAEKSFRLLDQLSLAQSTVVHCLNYNPAVFCVEMTSYWPVHIAGVRARRVAQSRRFLRSLDGRWAGTRIRCTRSRLSCADDVIGHLMLAPRFSGGVLLRTHLICKVRVL